MDVNFEPLLILPEQLHDASTWQAEPEKRLMLAVLEDAVVTLARSAGKTDARTRQQVREITSWVSEDAPDGVFSFENICVVHGLDPAKLRTGMRRFATAATTGSTLQRTARRGAGIRHRVALSGTERR